MYKSQVIGGAVGGTTINSTKIFQGTGTFGNANTGFYLDNGGNFSLKDKLVFDGSTGNLSIAGAISATSGSIASSVTIGGTAASTVTSGAAAGATANQTSTADIRAVGAATSGTIAGISISGSELYQGTGTFGNANTGFYLGSNGTFSLKDKLLTFLLSPCDGIWRPSILNSDPTLYETVSSMLLSKVALKLDVNIPSAAASIINNDILE